MTKPDDSDPRLQLAGYTQKGSSSACNEDALGFCPSLGMAMVLDGTGNLEGISLAGYAAVLTAREVFCALHQQSEEDVSLVHGFPSFERTLLSSLFFSGGGGVPLLPVDEKHPLLAAAICSLVTANKRIFDGNDRVSALHNTGTTAALLAAYGDELVIAHVGNVRVYRWSDGLQCLTQSSEAVMGREASVAVSAQLLPLVRDEVFVLCTDGVYNAIPEALTARILATYAKDPPTACAAFATQVLRAENHSDDFAVCVCRVLEG